MALFRSEKPRVKKQQKVQEKPQIVKDYETYLGDVAQLLLIDKDVMQATLEGK